jgi:hypothetical protein
MPQRCCSLPEQLPSENHTLGVFAQEQGMAEFDFGAGGLRGQPGPIKFLDGTGRWFEVLHGAGRIA